MTEQGDSGDIPTEGRLLLIDGSLTAARRAFDETAWATDRVFRVHCLRQATGRAASAGRAAWPDSRSTWKSRRSPRRSDVRSTGYDD
jgi:hypothetical protein